MKVKHNCPNCGAPVYIDRRSCPYCETAYYTLQSEMVVTDPDFEDIERGLRYGIITANMVGLERITDSIPIYFSHFDIDYNQRLEMIR